MDQNRSLIEALRPFAKMYGAALNMRRGYSLGHGINPGSDYGAELTDADYKKAYELVNRWDAEHGALGSR